MLDRTSKDVSCEFPTFNNNVGMSALPHNWQLTAFLDPDRGLEQGGFSETPLLDAVCNGGTFFVSDPRYIN